MFARPLRKRSNYMNFHLIKKLAPMALLSVCLFVAFGCARAAAQPVRGQDWPQWGGPHRDFKSDSTGLAGRWPARGPRRLWSRPLGEGHSAIVAEGERLYTMYRRGQQEIVVSLDSKTGKTIWEYNYDASSLPKMDLSYGTGPHSTPLVSGALIMAIGSTGKLFCLEKLTGRKRWSHDLWQEYGGTFLHLGYSSSPIVYKNTLIVQVGGAGRALMAFDLNNGRMIWQALNYINSYSSPIIINVDGQDQLVAFMLNEIIGVDPNNGAFLWSYLISAKWDFHFNISTPVWGRDNLLFASAAYGIGGRVLRLTRSGGKTVVKELWQSERTRVHKENAVRVGDVIYASTGHTGPAFFTAIDAKTGRVLWQDRRFSHASFLYADGRFIILDEDGALGLATPAPNGLTVHSKVEMLTSRSWTVPTLVGRTLFLRDRKNIMALQL